MELVSPENDPYTTSSGSLPKVIEIYDKSERQDTAAEPPHVTSFLGMLCAPSAFYGPHSRWGNLLCLFAGID